MTVMNLRGVKESGAAFAGPTYFYIVMLILLIATGLYRIFVQHVGPIPDALLSDEALEVREGAKALSLMMLLRAFSSGAVALSGVEAVSNGVPAFQKPESRNAATTLMWMGGILGSCFLGVSVLACHLEAVPGRERRQRSRPDGRVPLRRQRRHVLAHDDRHVHDPDPRRQHRLRRLPPPRSIVARDGFLPRQFFNHGARLVFSNGVLFLALVAGALIVAFNGDISKLIPLYAFGVFTGFTLSQTRHGACTTATA